MKVARHEPTVAHRAAIDEVLAWGGALEQLR